MIGRVLQFVVFDKNRKKQPYRGNYVNIKDTCSYGVMCTWYNKSDLCCVFKLTISEPTYHQMNTYLCTLTNSCIENDDACKSDSTLGFRSSVITVGKEITLTKECCNSIDAQVAETREDELPTTCTNRKTEKVKNEKTWIKYDKTILTYRDKHILINGKRLTDMHINLGQQILQSQFKSFNGLQSTLYQSKHPIHNTSNAIQIIHVQDSHWAVISTVGCDGQNEVMYYDSVYTNLLEETEHIVARLIQPERFDMYQIDVKIMVTTTQSGSSECGLYALAICTALAFGHDPTQVIFNQEDMRSHLVECFQRKNMEPFPVLKRKRVKMKVAKTISIFICPVCKKLDNGTTMVECEICDKWYHNSCIPSYDASEKWFCQNCRPHIMTHDSILN